MKRYSTQKDKFRLIIIDLIFKITLNALILLVRNPQTWNEVPSTHTSIPVFWKRSFVFLNFSLPSICKWRFQHQKRSFLKRTPEWRFLKMPDGRSCVNRQKQRFSNTIISNIIQRKLCKGPYSICIVWIGKTM